MFCWHKHQPHQEGFVPLQGGQAGAPHQWWAVNAYLALLHPTSAPALSNALPFFIPPPALLLSASWEGKVILFCIGPCCVKPGLLPAASDHCNTQQHKRSPFCHTAANCFSSARFWLHQGWAETSGLSGEEKVSPSAMLTPSRTCRAYAYQSHSEQATT